jgi:hypothetical protein
MAPAHTNNTKTTIPTSTPRICEIKINDSTAVVTKVNFVDSLLLFWENLECSSTLKVI